MESDVNTPTQSLAPKAGWTLVAFGITLGGFGAWGSWTTVPLEALIAPMLIAAGLIMVALIWRGTKPMSQALEYSIMGLATVSAFANQLISILGRSYYSTDSAAFNEAATRILLKGKNPYATSLLPYASQLLKDINGYWTYTLGGGHVSAVSYPAGAFLLEVPLHWLGITHLPADILDLIAATVAIVFMWWVLPRSIRWLAPALLMSFIYLNGFANGGTDALFIPFLMLAVWQWDRFSDKSKNVVLRWSGPVALGMACAIKQSPWFVVPFLVIGVGFEARHYGRRIAPTVISYAGVVVATFLAINLPFIIWSASAWFHGILLPMTDPLIPDGNGIVTLVLHGLVPSVRIGYLSVAGVLAEVVLLAAFVCWYRTMKRAWLFVLPLVLFVPGRSLASYLVDFLPIAIVAAVTLRPATDTPVVSLAPRIGQVALGIPALGMAIMVLLAFARPLVSMNIVWAASADQGQEMIAIRVALTNDTNTTITPHLMVNTNTAHPNGFWIPAHHEHLVIGPHETKVVTLYPPTWVWAPGRGQFWSVEAFTKTPAGVSTTVPMRWMQGQPPN